MALNKKPKSKNYTKNSRIPRQAIQNSYKTMFSFKYLNIKVFMDPEIKIAQWQQQKTAKLFYFLKSSHKFEKKPRRLVIFKRNTQKSLKNPFFISYL